MEKLKFAFLVFAAMLALPLLSMMELNHNKKSLPVDSSGIEQKVTQEAGNFYFENSGNIKTQYQKKHFGKRYCK